MQHRFTMIRDFLGYALQYSWYLSEIIVFQLLLLFTGGAAISQIEGIEIGAAIYFAFVTGFTIGYGDIEPVTGLGRFVSILIGFVGLVFSGLIVAIATRALADTIKQRERREHPTTES